MLNPKIDIQVTVSTMSNHVEGEKLYSQKCVLTSIKKIEEPAVIINFEKGVNILKEKLYLIKIENLSDNNYIDIITGRVSVLWRLKISHSQINQYLNGWILGVTMRCI